MTTKPNPKPNPPAAATARTLPIRSGRGFALGVALCIALHVALAASSAGRKSATFDEGFHLVSGALNWLDGERRLHSGNGLLSQMVFGLPLVIAEPPLRFPSADVVIETQRVTDFHELTAFLAHVFFYELGNDAARILLLGRTVAFALGALLCLGVALWARRLFGAEAGLLACALCALSPNVLAHARLTTSDLLFTVTLLAAVALAWRSFWRPSPYALVSAGVALGALALTKLSALGAIPMLALLAATRALWPQPLAVAGRTLTSVGSRAAAVLSILALQGLVAVAVIWFAYGLRYEAVPEGRRGNETFDQQWAWAFERDSAVLDGIAALREQHLLPEAFLYTAAFVWRQADERRTFFRGRATIGGDWRFFPFAIAVKTPLALFALLAIAGAVARRAAVENARSSPAPSRAPPADALRSAAPLLAIAGVQGGFALGADINLGLRHVLPLYPVAFVFAAGAAARWTEAARARRVLVALSTAAFAASSLSIWPHYLAYFNLSVGPERAYRELVDSSLDWGQDLDALGAHLAQRRDPSGPVYLSYFGTADPLFHDLADGAGEPLARLPGFFDWPTLRNQWDRIREPVTLEPGLYAISATMLQQAWSRVPNPIDATSESRYVELRARFAELRNTAEGAERLQQILADPERRPEWIEYRELRLAHLCRELRRREPDTAIGYSLLLYEVDRAELERAFALEPR